MCWQTKQKRCAVRKTARKDIEVFKIVNKSTTGVGYIPYFYSDSNLVYRRGQTYKHWKRVRAYATYYDDFKYRAYEGFHSYNPQKVHIEPSISYSDLLWTTSTVKNINLCSYVLRPNYVGPYKMMCIIPKGTTYYENEYGEIISEAIVVKSFRKINLYKSRK